MFEGKHIHFSPTDNKPLCSYSGKLCRQRRLNGYAFCIRHILEDKSAPFKQCSYVTRNNSQKCLNAIPTNQDRGYCHSHMQVVGIIPKTERKSKTVLKVDSVNGNSSSSGSEKSLASPPTPSSLNVKKDPGAVFKFEEDSTDVGDLHFVYKNGLSSSSSTTNGTGKSSAKGNKDNSNNSCKKDGKSCTKIANGFTGSFTTKKVTDKNKNIYTAIVPTSKTQNSSSSNSRKSNWSTTSSTDTFSFTTKKSSSSIASHLQQSGFKREGQLREGCESKLNKVQDVDVIRQFEQLKTLKQLDKSILTAKSSLVKEEDGNNNGSLQSFPRLASAKSSSSGSTPEKRISPPQSPATTSGNRVKCEILSNPQPTPPSSSSSTTTASSSSTVSPIITRCNNGIVIKTENPNNNNNNVHNNNPGQKEKTEGSKNSVENDSILSSSTPENISNNNISNYNNYKDSFSTSNIHCNSIDNSPEDSKQNRHEFLAQVRNTFKSQYKSIKKSSKVSEKCERIEKRKFRESLMKCVKIDSSICAQVLLGYGFKLPVFSGAAAATTIKSEEGNINNNNNNNGSVKTEYDDYEFFDTDSSSSSTSFKVNTASFNDHTKSKKGGATAKKNGCIGRLWKGEEEKAAKGPSSKTAQRKLCFGREIEKTSGINHNDNTASTTESDKHSLDESTSKFSKNGKKLEKGRLVEVTKDSVKQYTPAFKRRLKRSDAQSSTDNSLGSTSDSKDEGVMGSPLNSVSSESTSKKRKFGGNDAKSSSSAAPSPSGSDLTAPPYDSKAATNTPSGSSSQGASLSSKSEGDGLKNTLGQSKAGNNNNSSDQELRDLLSHPTSSRRNQGLETVLNSVGSSENAGTPDGVITDASFDSTFDHSASSQQDCEFSEDDLENSFELQIDPEIESQASRLLEDNVLTEADFTELFPDNRMSDHKFGRNDLQELGMGGLEFDVNDIDYSLFANIFPNFSRTGGQPESISISNQF